MPFTTAGKNQMLNNFGITHAGLFDGDPESGGTECSGGGYARQSDSFSSASGGSKAASGTPTFSVPSGFTVRYVSWHTASSGGTLIAKASVSDEAFGSAGTYTLTTQTFSLS